MRTTTKHGDSKDFYVLTRAAAWEKGEEMDADYWITTPAMKLQYRAYSEDGLVELFHMLRPRRFKLYAAGGEDTGELVIRLCKECRAITVH